MVVRPSDSESSEVLPEYHVRARNLFRASANQIHDDAVARTYGDAGGLVTGTTLYAYMTHPLVARWGLKWLARGTARVRFRRPVYEGDTVRVRARVVGRSGGPRAGEIAVELEADSSREPRVATGVAGLAWGASVPGPGLADYPEAPLPAAPPPVSAALLARLGPLGSPTLALEPGELACYVGGVEDSLRVYQGKDAVAHPGLLLQQANRALSENVTLGPWAHVESDVAHLGPARVGDRLTTRGRVARVLERRDHRYVELDLLVVADAERPVAHIRHTAIYELRPAPP